jgi:transcriptional regulator with XRE-family HTH domain
MVTSEQVRAARALLRWEQKHLAEAARVSLATVEQIEAIPGPLCVHRPTAEAIVGAFSAAGVVFTNSGEIGVRLRCNRHQGGIPPEQLTAENDG